MLFKDERFGMFIHFGIYAQTGWHEQYQVRMGVPKEEYVKLKDCFNPASFDADHIVQFAKEAGAQYICFTTKHHDGFCMWDTKYTDYNIMNTPYGKDILKELAEACEKYDMKLELYYSVPDWNYKHSVNDGSDAHMLMQPNPGDEPDEDLYIAYVKNQMTELCTDYGKIYGIFWDIPPKRRDSSVNELVRSLQPHILINDRGYDKGDYYTPQKLIASMATILMRGGNFLLNVGPDRNGCIPAKSGKIFAAVGDWYKRIQESILETGYVQIKGKHYTCRGNTVYLHLPAAFGCEGISLKPSDVLPTKVTLLNNRQALTADICYYPSDYAHGRSPKAYLHIGNIPAECFLGENMVIKMEFEDAEAFLHSLEVSTF